MKTTNTNSHKKIQWACFVPDVKAMKLNFIGTAKTAPSLTSAIVADIYLVGLVLKMVFLIHENQVKQRFKNVMPWRSRR